MDSLCGTNYYSLSNGNPAPNVCNMIQLSSDAPENVIEDVERVLLSLFPPSINITMEGGAVAALPTATIVNDCQGSVTKSVTVCSYVSPGPVFWLASPWFNNRFTLFDARKPNPQFNGSFGTMYWSDTISGCSFSPTPQPTSFSPPPPSPPTAPQPTSSYIVGVSQLGLQRSPYNRGISNQLIRIAIGTDGNVATFSDSVSALDLAISLSPS